MPQLIVIGIVWIAAGLLSAYLLGRVIDTIGKSKQKQLPPETDWLIYPLVPAYVGWYYTRHKLEERMKYWDGKAWRYSPEDKHECYLRDCDFKGLTEKVEV